MSAPDTNQLRRAWEWGRDRARTGIDLARLVNPTSKDRLGDDERAGDFDVTVPEVWAAYLMGFAVGSCGSPQDGLRVAVMSQIKATEHAE